MLNEFALESIVIRKIFLTDVSGFFATGLLIYELYSGRRDAVLQVLLASSIICAVVVNAVYNLAWLRDHTGQSFDDWIVAAICLVSILIIVGATHIRRLPLSAGAVIAVGGMTYPLYLLHQQIGYDIINQIGPVGNPAMLVALIVLAITLLSWAIWRFVENPARRLTTQAATRLVVQFHAASFMSRVK